VTRDGKIVGAIVIGSRKGVREIGAMIERGTPVARHAGSIAREDFDYTGALKGA